MSKIIKQQISNGMFWVEVPEAQLRILCGCPADSVKHLLKQRFITTRETNGVTYETGPNAILLSDLLVQNGLFSNLSEFPVLQMLYRQGMILPNHPNNTGIKPLLIGSRDQVNAQMQYIYRGNYGLISEEEIMEAAIPAEMAKRMMQLKLKFAFGHIKHPKELLDVAILENEPVDVRAGVTVRNLSLNQFEISYEGESVHIDLNISPNADVEPLYALEFYRIDREYFTVVHSGEGDGWDINRPCMSSILMFQGKIYLIDAGPNILDSLKALGIGLNEVHGIFHTHAHDDHFAGLPALMQADHRLKYYATPLVRSSVTKKMSALLSIEEESFFHYFEIHDLEFDVWNNVDGLEVKALFSPHPVENNIFIFRALGEEGFRTYAHFADIVSMDVLGGMITPEEDEFGITEDYFNQVNQTYLTPVDLKKLDIGGGLIHGKAEDFKTDTSQKIILSHTAFKLTDKQKEIGSSAIFGAKDTLIPARENYVWRSAFQILQDHFPAVPADQIRILVNSEVETYNPESIILKQGAASEYVLLILTGTVALIQSDLGIHHTLSTGELIGELSALTGDPSLGTYRSISFVQILRIKIQMFIEFVKHNNLIAELSFLKENQKFLHQNPLFGESISTTIQNRIAHAMQSCKYKEGHELSLDTNTSLYVVQSGTLECYLGDDVFETLTPGSYFGEEGAIFNTLNIFHVRSKSDVELYQIPGGILSEIPIVRWKLFESYEKRLQMLTNSELSSIPIYHWREEYSVQVQRVDNQHKELFKMANKLFEAVESGQGKQSIETVLNFLIEYTHFHFSEEEAMMKQYHYPEFESHCKKHKILIDQVLELQHQFKHNEKKVELTFLDFLKDWIIEHILDEDRKYSHFLNQRGVY